MPKIIKLKIIYIIIFLLFASLNNNSKYEYFIQENYFAGNWTELGPTSLVAKQGRINCIAIHPTNENIIYAGTPTGGIWQSNDFGKTWFTNTDHVINNGVSAIAIDYSNPKTIYIGTGDKSGQPNGKPGTGLYKTNDGGKTWTSIKSTIKFKKIFDIKIHPTNSNIIFCVSNDGKIHKTTDKGKTWKLSLSKCSKQIIFHPTNPNIIYTTETNGRFHKSINCGKTWKVISGQFPQGNIKIAVSKHQPNFVFCMIDKKGLYKSINLGESFSKISECNYKKFYVNTYYNFTFAIDQKNSDILYCGTIYLWRSIDGGLTWEKKPSKHNDNHFLIFSPLNNYLVCANDGGICYTKNNADTWLDISKGLNITQIYSFGQNAFGNKVLIGTQDNGVSLWSKGLYNNKTTWKTIYTGDVHECIASTYLFFELKMPYPVKIYRADSKGQTKIIVKHGKNGIDPKESRYLAFALDKTDAKIMYVGYSNLYKCSNINVENPDDIHWEKISSFENKKSCGIIEQSSANGNIVYIKKGNEFLFRSDNFLSDNIKWTALKVPNDNLIYDIKTHHSNENIIYLLTYKKIWKSTDKGENWQDISGSLPEISFTSLAINKNMEEDLYIGSSVGVYYKNAQMDDWKPFNKNLPLVKITKLDIFHDTTLYIHLSPLQLVDTIKISGKIRASTYGRGLWESDLAEESAGDN